ncbi:hypothetical protein [Flavihumibacter sp. CACIAM 22H1]|uniref:hypothetical protein n=1 Tax=Flavihumibacter sp. CACIAM 22H1 TaxID=1812911 RepID=UPI0007A914E6|nr:hypothetical protein [Flavihumibacter sp. CACIAM 22H1]KYP15559.1 MAG: hypothetical protein A1D16_07890 [Flavihumibacter sp. CACIAM 22H1]
MKKGPTLFIVIFILVVMLLLATQYLHTTATHQVQIGLSFTRTLEQLQDSNRLNKWFNNHLANGKKIQLRQLKKNPLIATYVFSDGKNTQEFNWMAVPEAGNEYFTRLSLQYKTSWWNYITGGNQLEKAALQNTANLEKFTKDIQLFYGYRITTTTVKDSTLLYGSIRVRKEKKGEETYQLFQKLMTYANQINAGPKGSSICNFEKISTDSILIKASIGITKPNQLSASSSFQLKRMPYGKNLLMMEYNGKFGEIDKAYKVLEQFRDDHNFRSMAIPYQEYPVLSKIYSDNDTVTLNLYYPVF